jgi:glucan phosphoethanolaminetransferase (alkaline phosphatase superfamily)
MRIGELSSPPQMQRKTHYSLYALLSMLAAPLVVMLAWSYQAQAWRSILTLLLSAVLCFLLIAGLTRTWRSLVLCSFPLLVLGVAYTALTLQMGIVPGRAMALLLNSSAPEDIIGAVRVSGGTWPAVVIIALLGGYLHLAWRLPNRLIFSRPVVVASRITLALCLAAVALVAGDAAELIDGLAINPYTGPLIFLSADMPRARAELRGALVAKIPYRAHRTRAGEEIHVLVVGESVRRDSWSVYGYKRPTTPYLYSLKGEAIFLQNVIADANLTEWAFPMMLTGLSPQEYDASRLRGNLVDLAREAGYSTAWLTNQDVRMADMIGIAPDHLEYRADLRGNINGRHLLDEVMLPAYQREIAARGTSRFIGVHLMGSHWEYYLRYPPAFQRFGTASHLNMLSIFTGSRDVGHELVDSYDNSIYYTDWFLRQLIESLRVIGVPATVTYFPDHGEDLEPFDGEAGHGQPKYTPHAFEIPAFVWLNDAYRSAHPDIYAALKRNVTKEIRTHNVFYTVAQLMGISWPENSPDKSFASDRFAPDTTRQHIAGGVLITRPRDVDPVSSAPSLAAR